MLLEEPSLRECWNSPQGGTGQSHGRRIPHHAAERFAEIDPPRFSLFCDQLEATLPGVRPAPHHPVFTPGTVLEEGMLTLDATTGCICSDRASQAVN